MTLLDPLFRWDAVHQHFSDRAHLQGMLDFEAALARALYGVRGLLFARAPQAFEEISTAKHSGNRNLREIESLPTRFGGLSGVSLNLEFAQT